MVILWVVLLLVVRVWLVVLNKLFLVMVLGNVNLLLVFGVNILVFLII